MSILILVRHGQSIWNLEKKFIIKLYSFIYKYNLEITI